jgi:hypothetical protein
LTFRVDALREAWRGFGDFKGCSQQSILCHSHPMRPVGIRMTVVFHAQAIDLNGNNRDGDFFANPVRGPVATALRMAGGSSFTDLSTCHVDKGQSRMASNT